MKKIIISISILAIALFWVIRKNDTHQPEPKQETEEEATNTGFFKYRMASRAGKDGKIPFNALVKAKRHIDRMPKPSGRDAGLWEWDWLGPSNIGGRIRTILPDPNNSNVLWTGSVSGGIWKSTNAGASWSPADDFMTSLAVTSMVFDPSSTNIMYAATGEGFGNHDGLPGAGILKSTDGGLTWNQLSSTDNSNFKWVTRLAAHPNSDSAGVLYATTGSSHVFKTTDGGATWVNKLNTSSGGRDVKIDPNNPNEILVGCSNDAYMSTDYGETWTKLSIGGSKLPVDPGRCEVSFCPSNTSKLYISIDSVGGQLWSSNDNGNTWSLKNTGSNYLETQGGYDHTIWVCPTNSNKLVVGGMNFFRSTNGGTNLTKISSKFDYHYNGSCISVHADQHCIIEASDFDDLSNPRVYISSDGGIQKTDNIWTVSETSGWVNLVNTSLGITQFYSGAAANDGSIIIGGTQDNGTNRYRASGSWSGPDAWKHVFGGDGGCVAINYNNTNILFTEYTNLEILKSVNGGDQFSLATTGLGDATIRNRSLFISPYVMDPNNPDYLVAGGSRIWRTTNGASNWVKIRDEIGYSIHNGDTTYVKCSAIDIAEGNSSKIWVAYNNGNIAMTTNAGASWTRVDNNSSSMPHRYVTDIAINPNSSDEVFVTFGGYFNNDVWYTADAGATWENKSGTPPNDLPAIQVNTVRYHPSNSFWIYIGTDLGVFATKDRGLNWSIMRNFDDNEGPVNTEVSELFWQGDEFLIAATHGRGMYRTSSPPRIIYVDLNAAPGGNGSVAHPFQTIYEASQAYGPGTTISIKSGTYEESQIIFFEREGYVITTNGSVLIK
ncbi:MAG: hypothetical protein DRI89_04805 [Bacteroidetes bacterium]|nr:MAG: hypothetical protein DRI89_04805 [Bacteroidota bacterium]